MQIRVTCLLALLANTVAAQTLIEDRGPLIWHYVDDGQQQDAGWTAPSVDTSKWKQGRAPFGFGEPDVVTKIAAGNGDAVHPTTYFRGEFQVADPASFNELLLQIRVDDAFVAYLNGREVARWNLPDGEIGFQTLATERLSGAIEQLYQQIVVSAAALRKGANVLAVEVHQAGTASSDLFLDVRLQGMVDQHSLRPRLRPDAGPVTRRFQSLHFLGPDAHVPDGYLDGGRGMQIDEFGNAVSGREIIAVDRRADSKLRQHLDYASSKELAELSEVDRATRIARYIDQLYSPAEGRDGAENRSNYLATRYATQQVLLGDVPLLCGAGVCRHRSLLFKLMGDEAKLRVALVRGNYLFGAEQIGGHAWNELTLQDGKKVIVDVMNPQPDFYFPEVGEPSLRRYLTVANAPKYSTRGPVP